MKQNSIYLLTLLLLSPACFATAKYKVNSEQKKRYDQIQLDGHEMNKFHQNMINYWILTGEIKATSSIEIPEHELEKQVVAVALYTESTNQQPRAAQQTKLSCLENAQAHVKEIQIKLNSYVERIKEYLRSK